VLAGWALILSRLSGQEDVVVGAPEGVFANTLALRVDLSGSPTPAELLARVKAVTLGAQAHQDLPFEQVIELVRPACSPSYTPIFQVAFAWGDAGLPDSAVSQVDMTLVLGEAEGRIT